MGSSGRKGELGGNERAMRAGNMLESNFWKLWIARHVYLGCEEVNVKSIQLVIYLELAESRDRRCTGQGPKAQAILWATKLQAYD